MEDYEVSNEEDAPLYDNLEDEGIFEDLDEETLTMLELLDESYDEDPEEDELDTLDFDFEFDDEDVEGTGSSEIQELRNMFIPKLKSRGVNYEGVSSKIKEYLGSLPEEYRNKLLVTSGKDGTHSKGSKHYIGNAVDLRFDENLHSYINKTASSYGLKTMNPYHGTAPHTHLEVMQMGGLAPLTPRTVTPYNPGFDPDYLSDRMQHDTAVVMERGAGVINQPTGPSISGLVDTVDTIGSGVEKIKSFNKQKNKLIFDTINSGVDTAISILGQSEQNQELRRLAKQRAEAAQSYEQYTPQIKNVPIYI